MVGENVLLIWYILQLQLLYPSLSGCVCECVLLLVLDVEWEFGVARYIFRVQYSTASFISLYSCCFRPFQLLRSVCWLYFAYSSISFAPPPSCILLFACIYTDSYTLGNIDWTDNLNITNLVPEECKRESRKYPCIWLQLISKPYRTTYTQTRQSVKEKERMGTH